jgi:two-component sensor histidine kinase
MIAHETPTAARSPALDVAARTNDRIADNLTMIAGWLRMRGADLGERPRRLTGSEVRLLLDNLGERLEIVARLHGLLARQPDEPIAIAEYLREIAAGIVASAPPPTEVNLEFNADQPCLMAPERALALGLLVGELLTNAIKFAHPSGVAGRIALACRGRPDGMLTLALDDDGVGLPEGLDPMKQGGMGFQLVRSLAQQLGATIAFDSDALGCQVRLRMAAG